MQVLERMHFAALILRLVVINEKQGKITNPAMDTVMGDLPEVSR